MALFAAVIERYHPETREWSPEGIEHVKAPDLANARAQFALAAMADRNIRIVAIAPTVGVFGKEVKGKLVLYT